MMGRNRVRMAAAALAVLAGMSGCLSPAEADTGLQWPTLPEWYAPLDGEGIQMTQWTDETGACLFVGVHDVSWGGLDVSARCGAEKSWDGFLDVHVCTLASGERWVWQFEEHTSITDRAIVLMGHGLQVPVRRGGPCGDIAY
jgi:hypothetical protein